MSATVEHQHSPDPDEDLKAAARAFANGETPATYDRLISAARRLHVKIRQSQVEGLDREVARLERYWSEARKVARENEADARQYARERDQARAALAAAYRDRDAAQMSVAKIERERDEARAALIPQDELERRLRAELAENLSEKVLERCEATSGGVRCRKLPGHKTDHEAFTDVGALRMWPQSKPPGGPIVFEATDRRAAMAREIVAALHGRNGNGAHAQTAAAVEDEEEREQRLRSALEDLAARVGGLLREWGSRK